MTTLAAKTGVNSLTPQQLDQLIHYAFTHNIHGSNLQMLQAVPGPSIIPGQVIYMTNFSASPYPRIHVPNSLWNSWNPKPLTRNFLLHLVFLAMDQWGYTMLFRSKQTDIPSDLLSWA